MRTQISKCTTGLSYSRRLHRVHFFNGDVISKNLDYVTFDINKITSSTII